MSKHARRTALWSALFVASAAFAQASATKEGQELLQAGRTAEAYQLLEKAEVDNAGQVDFDLALARAANAVGEYTRAIMALERVLQQQPANKEARAEMGRALAGVGDHKAARALLTETKSQGVDTISGANVDQLLHAIERVESDGVSAMRSFVEANAGYDSNINSAPGLSNVAVPALGGTILAIDPAGSRKSGGFIGASAGVTGRKVIDPRWSVIGAATARLQKFSNNNSASDNGQLDGNIGVSYREERNEYSVVAQAGTYELDGKRARDVIGLVGEYTYRFDAFRQLNFYVQASRLSYPQVSIADADRYVVGMTYAHQAGSVFAYGGAYTGRESVRNDTVPQLGHHLWGVRGGVQFPVRENVTGIVSAGYESRDYGGLDPLFLVTRRDHQTNFVAGLSWAFSPGWRLLPQWAWSHTTSSSPLAVYQKNAVSLSVRRDF